MLTLHSNIGPEIEEALLKTLRNHLQLAHERREAIEDQCGSVLRAINTVKRMSCGNGEGATITIRDVVELMVGTVTGNEYNITFEDQKFYFGADGRSTWPVEFCRDKYYREQEGENRGDDYFADYVDELAGSTGGVNDFDCTTFTFTKVDLLAFARKLIADQKNLEPAAE